MHTAKILGAYLLGALFMTSLSGLNDSQALASGTFLTELVEAWETHCHRRDPVKHFRAMESRGEIERDTFAETAVGFEQDDDVLVYKVPDIPDSWYIINMRSRICGVIVRDLDYETAKSLLRERFGAANNSTRFDQNNVENRLLIRLPSLHTKKTGVKAVCVLRIDWTATSFVAASGRICE